MKRAHPWKEEPDLKYNFDPALLDLHRPLSIQEEKSMLGQLEWVQETPLPHLTVWQVTEDRQEMVFTGWRLVLPADLRRDPYGEVRVLWSLTHFSDLMNLQGTVVLQLEHPGLREHPVGTLLGGLLNRPMGVHTVLDRRTFEDLTGRNLGNASQLS